MSPARKNILVVAPSWVGDAVMAVPAVRALKETVAGARVTVLSKERTLDIFYALHAVDGVEHFGSSLIGTAWRLRPFRFDQAVVLPNSFRSAAVVFLAGIPERIGYAKELRGPLLTRTLPVEERLARMHQVDYYLDIAYAAGARRHTRDLSLDVAPEDLASAKELLAEAGLDEAAPLVALHPGAAFGPAKRWPPERFARAMNLLHSQSGINLVLLGSPGEAQSAADLTRMLDFSCLDLTGKTTLGQAAAVISLAALFISNDSGLMHVAAALKKPQVALFGSTEPKKTAPLNENAVLIRRELDCSPCFLRECPLPETLCWEGIREEEVADAAARLLQSSAK